MSIVVRTLAERVFEIVRERIAKGDLAGDEPIRQDALAGELGISKIPVREALGRLEQEGLLVSHANRGYVVQSMSSEQADEIFALRLSIEPRAAACAARAATEPERKRARDAFDALENAAERNLADVAVKNRDFHTQLVRPGGRLLTTQLVERLAILAERYVVAHLKPAGRDARAHLEHRALLEAWLDRDEKRVESLLAFHIEGTLHDLRTQFAVHPCPLSAGIA